MTFIEKPSQLPIAIGEVLKSAFPQLRVGNHQDFQITEDKTGVLITVERNGLGIRSLEGRKAHALSISLKAMIIQGVPFEACDLASQLMDLVLDNRWGLPPEQCDLPAGIVAAPGAQGDVPIAYDIWTVSFIQTLYLGPPLLEDPAGRPLFACTWDVSNIDDPDQYRPLGE